MIFNMIFNASACGGSVGHFFVAFLGSLHYPKKAVQPEGAMIAKEIKNRFRF
jgi:hypothetical protein